METGDKLLSFTGEDVIYNFPFVSREKKDVFIHVSQYFSDSWEKEWIYSKHPGKEFGKFVRTAGKFYNDADADKGMYETISV